MLFAESLTWVKSSLLVYNKAMCFKEDKILILFLRLFPLLKTDIYYKSYTN